MKKGGNNVERERERERENNKKEIQKLTVIFCCCFLFSVERLERKREAFGRLGRLLEQKIKEKC